MGRKHTWETALTPRETEEALCHGARPWSRLDQWTARNTWFARVRPGGLRLVRTGPIGGHVRADVALTAVGDGTRIEMTLRLPAGFFLFHGVFWLAAGPAHLAGRFFSSKSVLCLDPVFFPLAGEDFDGSAA